jgi:TolB protein
MPRIFISYRRTDSRQLIRPIRDGLARQFGKNSVFADIDQMAPGESFPQTLTNQLQNSDVVLVIIGSQWLDARNFDGTRRLDDPLDWVRREVEIALERRAEKRIKVIPVLTEDAEMPLIDQLPTSMKPLVNLQAVRIRDDEGFNDDLKRLNYAIRPPRWLPQILLGLIVLPLLGFLYVVLVPANPPEPPPLTVTPDFNPTDTPISLTPTLSPTLTPNSVTIVYYSNLTGNNEIYLLPATGGNPQPLTRNGSNNRFPAWSPDGARLLFQSNLDGDNDIYLINRDGSGLLNLTNNDREDLHPAWSPNGEEIAYTAAVGPSNWDIIIYNLQTSAQRNLTRTDNVEEGGAAWSPDGLSLAYYSNRNGSFDLFISDVHGSAVRQMTFSPADELMPDWSPDGRYLAFSSGGDDQADIYVLQVVQELLYQLTNTATYNLSPDWLPDGRLVFSSNREGNFEIYLMNSDSTGVQRLTQSGAVDGSPSAQPQPGLVSSLGPADLPPPIDRPVNPSQITATIITGQGIGAPLGASARSQAAYQDYEQGFMVWRDDTEEVYVFSVDNVTIVPISVYNNYPVPQENPPEGRYLPVNAFGKVWANYGQVRSVLGWPVTGETGYYACITSYSRHLAVTLPDGRALVIEPAAGSSRFANSGEVNSSC